jgi:hypothetical protein
MQFTDADGIQWYDWRAAKANGNVGTKHPDFKTGNQSKYVGQSIWIFCQDGDNNPEATPLIAAADQMAALTAPM